MDLISYPNPSQVTEDYRNYPPCSFPSPTISNFEVFLLAHDKLVKTRSLLSCRINHRYWNESNIRQQQIAENMYIVHGTHSFRMSENNKCWVLHTSLGKGYQHLLTISTLKKEVAVHTKQSLCTLTKQSVYILTYNLHVCRELIWLWLWYLLFIGCLNNMLLEKWTDMCTLWWISAVQRHSLHNWHWHSSLRVWYITLPPHLCHCLYLCVEVDTLQITGQHTYHTLLTTKIRKYR